MSKTVLESEERNNDAGHDRRRAFPEQQGIAFEQRGHGGAEMAGVGMAEVEQVFRQALVASAWIGMHGFAECCVDPDGDLAVVVENRVVSQLSDLGLRP